VKVGDVSGATCRPVDDQHLGVCSVSLGKDETNWPTSGKSTMYIWWDFAWKKDEKGGGEVLIASYQSLA